MSSLLPSTSARAIALGAASGATEAGIVSRTVLQTEELRVTHFSFAPGQELTTHTNRRRALVQVLEGSCEFLFDGAWHTLEAGALLHLPPSHPHAVRATDRPFSMLLTLGSDPAP